MSRTRALVAIILIVLGGWLALRGYRRAESPSDGIVGVKERHEAWLLRLPGVVGVGIGNCDARPCLKIYMKQRTPESERRIPRQLDGFKTDIEVSGPIQTQPPKESVQLIPLQRGADERGTAMPRM
jgi:hypothetical protein